MPDCIKSLYSTEITGIITPFVFSLQLRPGFDPSSISEAVDTIKVPTNAEQGKGSVSGLVASKCGLVAVLERIDQKMLIYNQERTAVLEFPLDCSYANQITFDRHHNIVVAKDNQSSLLRYNMNGKALPNLELPEHIRGPTGVACSPEGDLYVSCNDPYTILKQVAGESEWVTLYRGQEKDYDSDSDEDEDDDEDEDEDDDEDRAFDPARFSPGQISFGNDGELFVATDNCINVLASSDGKLKRQMGCDKYRDGEMSKVEGIFATGDGYLFACDQDYNVHVFTFGGDHLCRFGEYDVGQFQPWAITVDCSGYLLISDIENGRIQVY